VTPTRTKEPSPATTPERDRLARVVLVWFLFVFIAARVLVLLIMLRRLPDLFVHVGQTHVHHLNYGIILLAGVAGVLLFHRPSGRKLTVCATVYGVAMALTFDEFGMWLRLGGSYWQRASFDAVIVIASVFALIAAASRLRQFRTRHWLTAGAVAMALAVFGGLIWRVLVEPAEQRLAPTLRAIEESGPQ
jgi:hypothetical protein